MTRRMKILRNTAIGVAAFLLLAFVAGTRIVQTDWFRGYVRERIIALTEEAIGGRVEVQSFSFDWRHLSAEVNDFVIHGSEPKSEAPFVQAAKVHVDLALFSSFSRLVGVRNLEVERPRVNVITLADGSLNVPQSKAKASGSNPLESVVDLAIGKFALQNGTVRYNDISQPLEIRGENLRLQLAYDMLKRSYQGQLDLQPAYVVRGRNTPVVLSLRMPLLLERDRISLTDASLSTALSQLKISGSLANLKQPESRFRLTGNVAIEDLNKLGNLSLAAGPRTAQVLLDADASMQKESVRVEKFHASVGGSTIDAHGQGTIEFTSELKLDELLALAKSAQQVHGDVHLDGSARYEANVLDLQKFHLRGFGGEATGEARLEKFKTYAADGQLGNLNLQNILRQMDVKPLPYDGTINGKFNMHGDLDAPGAGLVAGVDLKVSPGRRGVPVSGQIYAHYEAANGIVSARNSFLALPHSRLEFNGSLQNGLKLDLTSQDLRDLAGVPSTIRLNGGALTVNAVARGTIAAPVLEGQLSANRIVLQNRQFDSVNTHFAAQKSRFTVTDGRLARGAMQSEFNGAVGLLDWSPTPNQPLTASANLNNGDLADVLALAGQPTAGYSGALTAKVNIAGTVGNPTGLADVTVSQGSAEGEPFDVAQVKLVLEDQLIRIPSAHLTKGQEQIDLTAELRHPRDSFTTGRLMAHVVTSRLELAGLKAVQRARPGLAGELALDTNVEGNLTPGDFQLTKVSGNASVKQLMQDAEKFGDVTVKASTAQDTVSYDVTSNFAGSQLLATGRTRLTADYPSDINATISQLPIERVLLAAKRPDIPARGTASGSLRVTGTWKDPQGEANLDVRNAVFYEEPVDRLQVQLDSRATTLEVKRLDATAGPAQVALTGRFDHPQSSFDQGNVTFQLKSSGLDLARLRNVQLRRPGLAGVIRLTGEGKATVPAKGAVSIEDLQLALAATNIRAAGRALGNLELTAIGTGSNVNIALQSNLANADIRGKATATLRGDYPVRGEVTFSALDWANLQPLIGGAAPASLDGAAAGRLTVDGPVTNVEQLNASLRLSALSLRTTGSQPVSLQNQGDIAVSMAKGQMRIEAAHLAGQGTDINVTGTAALPTRTLDVKVNAKSNLGLLKAISADIHSEGSVDTVAVIQGTFQNPLVTGKLELHDASVASGDLPVGIAKANGVIVFNGNSATIQTLTGEAGGGRLSLSGSVTRSDRLRFALRANASGVRVRVQPGVSVVATANINLSGGTEASRATGSVTIDKLTYLPQTDIASILTRSAPPVQSADNTSPLLQNMVLDITVRTSAVTAVQASLAQNLQVNADLRVRGRASQPGVTGSVQMNHGELAFFGSTYRLSSGTISFFNPNRVEPILNITLETQAKGVNVVLSVTGTIDNMKLSYTSDPPLQFEEIVALLASGKAPTSDPTLLANQPSQPEQTFLQRGESALIGKALADPISNRLQRVFGVSQLKIDPTLTSGSQLPQARVTLQQQVTSNLLFTYVTALDNPNTQIIRVELSLNPQWSATANRDENGVVSINLLYKKQFR